MAASARSGRSNASGDRALRGAVWLYGLTLLALVAAIYGPGERLWPVTLFLFGPRWVLALPLAILLPAGLVLDRRMLAPIVACAWLVAFPLLGLRVPLRLVGNAREPDLRLATWNVGAGGFEPGQLGTLLTEASPDVVVLQECGARDVDFPRPWHGLHDRGQCLLSRFPIAAVESRDRTDMRALSGNGAIVRYALTLPWGTVHLTNIHLETPREGIEEILGSGLAGVALLEAKNRQRALEATLARRWVDRSPGPARLVAGDFNTPVESDLFREHWAGFQDCFGRAGLGFGHTKRTRRIGARIDHILAGPGWRCLDAQVHVLGGTDHRPLIVDLAWTGAR